MTETIVSDAATVPLIELLRRIPADYRAQWTDADGLQASHSAPVGKYCHDAALQLEAQRDQRLAANTTPTELAADGYLIRKHGMFYRPNAQGYTNSAVEAGRFTLKDAIAYSHPNGPDGPRDGISYLHESEVPASLTPATDERQADEPLSTDMMVSRASYNRLYHQFDLKCREVNALSAQLRTEERLAELLGEAVDQNAAMRTELSNVGNIISDLARTMGVDQANDDGSWPDIAGRRAVGWSHSAGYFLTAEAEPFKQHPTHWQPLPEPPK